MNVAENNPFEDLAKFAETNGSGAHHLVAAAQIRASGREYEQQKTMTLAVEYLNHEFSKLDQTVKNLNRSIDRFNEDTGKLYSTLNSWTKIIAAATIFSALCNLAYASFYIWTVTSKH